MDAAAARSRQASRLLGEWERGEATPGRVMANLKTAGMPDLLRQLAEPAEHAGGVSAGPSGRTAGTSGQAPRHRTRRGSSPGVPRPEGWRLGARPRWSAPQGGATCALRPSSTPFDGQPPSANEVPLPVAPARPLCSSPSTTGSAGRRWSSPAARSDLLRRHRGRSASRRAAGRRGDRRSDAALREADEEVRWRPRRSSSSAACHRCATVVSPATSCPSSAGWRARPAAPGEPLRSSASSTCRCGSWPTRPSSARVVGQAETGVVDHFFELEDETIWGRRPTSWSTCSVALGPSSERARRANGPERRGAEIDERARRASVPQDAKRRGRSDVAGPRVRGPSYTLRLPRTEDRPRDLSIACQDEAIQRFTLVPVPYLPSHAVGHVTAAEECRARRERRCTSRGGPDRAGRALGAASARADGPGRRGRRAGLLGRAGDARRQGVGPPRRPRAVRSRRGRPAGAGGADPDRQRRRPGARRGLRLARRSATARCCARPSVGPLRQGVSRRLKQVQAASTWRRSVIRCRATHTRTNVRPSATDRVKSAAPVALAAAHRRVGRLLAATVGEADEVERVRGDDLEPVVAAPPSRPARSVQPTWRRIIAWIGAGAVGAQREPQLQGAEPAGRAGSASRGSRRPRRRRPAAVRRYSGRIDSAPSSAARSAIQNRSQSKLTPIHLCGLVQYESARSSAGVDPAVLGTQRGDAGHGGVDVQPEPVRAGRRRRWRATGSKASDDVVPAVGAHEERHEPGARRSAMAAASASGRMANAPSCGDEAEVVGADAGDAQRPSRSTSGPGAVA